MYPFSFFLQQKQQHTRINTTNAAKTAMTSIGIMIANFFISSSMTSFSVHLPSDLVRSHLSS